jgi:fructose-bisphosphate aldolase, class I
MNLLDPITKNTHALFLAYDQGLEHGPSDFNDENVDPSYIMQLAESGYFTGVIFQKGIAEKYYDKTTHKTPLIVKLNGKTNLVTDVEPYSPPLCSIDEAISIGAKAVGYTIFVGSEFEAQMTKELAPLEEEAHKNNLPLILWMYPRGKAVEGRERSGEIVKYAARMGLELGADMVKVYRPIDDTPLSEIIKIAGRTKVVFSGGNKETDEGLFETAKKIMEAGAAGMAVGRNIWQADNALDRAEQLATIIFNT